MPSSRSPKTITTPVPPTSAARMIFQSSFQLISAVAMVLIVACSGVRRRGLSQPSGPILRCDGGAVQLAGRDLAALRELEQHHCARDGNDRDHDRAGRTIAEQIRDLPGGGSD